MGKAFDIVHQNTEAILMYFTVSIGQCFDSIVAFLTECIIPENFVVRWISGHFHCYSVSKIFQDTMLTGFNMSLYFVSVLVFCWVGT